jgi:predicted DsbA family dithiol-disulfide isomerase
MHDMLFDHHHALDEGHLVHYAPAVGLDLAPLRLALTTHAHARRVREDFVSGVHGGVSSTPALFINGARYDGPIDLDSLWTALVEACAARGHRLAPWEDLARAGTRSRPWSGR